MIVLVTGATAGFGLATAKRSRRPATRSSPPAAGATGSRRSLPKIVPAPHGGDMSAQDLASHDLKSPIIVFDVNETLLDFNVLKPVFIRIFGDPNMVRVWFDNVVLYSEALTLAGEYAESGSVGVAVLEMLAQTRGRTVDAADLTDLKRLSAEMPTYDDTPEALAKLKSAGFRLVTLSNNPTAGVDIQLQHAKIRTFFDELHSIDDRVHRYKPARESYTELASKLGVPPADLWLVSCHAFDTLGAAAAGYRTALVLRPENAAIALGRAPDIVEADLGRVAARLVEAIDRQRSDRGAR